MHILAMLKKIKAKMQSQIILCLVMHGTYESLCLLIYDNDNTVDCLMIFVIVQ